MIEAYTTSSRRDPQNWVHSIIPNPLEGADGIKTVTRELAFSHDAMKAQETVMIFSLLHSVLADSRQPTKDSRDKE